ncbi:MAG: hypothetical protein ACRDVC_05605 [Acidimicrobiales bacterium]
MSHRFTTWWRALSVVFLSLATVTWPSAAWAGTTPHFDVVHQSSVASLSPSGTARFGTTITITPSSASASAIVTIYPVITARSELAPIVDGVGPGVGAVSTTGSFALRCLHAGKASFNITLYTKSLPSPPRSCQGITPHLKLYCSNLGCGGVYPIRYVVSVNGAQVTKWSLLAVQSAKVSKPLQVALVATVTQRALHHPDRSIHVLNTLAHYPKSPLTVSTDYPALAAIQLNATRGPAWVSALERALDSPLHRAIDAPPSNADFAGLAAHHLATQVGEQLTLSSQLLTTMTGHYVDDPVLLSGAQSSQSLLALDRSGFNEVVLPEKDLREAPSATLTWGAPFHVTGAGSLTALSIDGPLSQLTHDTAIEPGRRAAMTLDTLAFLHYEAPYAPATRSVVIASPVNSTSDTFFADFLSGIDHDPFVQLASLSPSFSSSLVGTNGAPSARTLTETTPSTWSTNNVSSLLTLIGAVNSFAQSVKSSNIATVLRVAVAKSEVRASPSSRQNDIDAANHLLKAQLAQFSIDQSTITLAGSGTALPITIISHLHYTVKAVVHLVTDRLTFPGGDAVPVTLDSPTQSIRVPATNPRGSSLTLQVILTTPNDQVVLERTAVQVHIAGTSVVGYLLTFASLFVLGLWWWRTTRRRPKGRHVR